MCNFSINLTGERVEPEGGYTAFFVEHRTMKLEVHMTTE
jgi:hypothetical protein